MKNFSRGGDRGDFKKGGFKKPYREDRGPITMHKAVCASCGKSCEVPFRPSDGKPVYCRDCFAGRSAMGGERSHRKDPRTFTPSFAPQSTSANTAGNAELKKQIETMNVKLDKLVAIVQELTLKGALKEVTNESKETPRVVEETEVKVATKKVFKKK